MYRIASKQELNANVTQMEIEAPLVAAKAQPGQFIILRVDEAGESIQDFVGPLGVPTHTEGLKKVCIIGGGVGCAIALPIAEEFHKLGAEVTSIIGFRSKDIVILEEDFKACSDKLIVMTDDGSYGRHGNVTVPLKELLEAGEKYDMIITIGHKCICPFPAMRVSKFEVEIMESESPVRLRGMSAYYAEG